ncbi:MAG: 4Fe-4S cluster-binding domain-containing protein [Bacteroidales bacterium]|nr:4Fe-4S cluster-binding domain-containing protein [Bacteroidales bacterium]
MTKIYAEHLFLNISSSCNINCDVCYGHLCVDNKSKMELSTAKAATEFYYKNRDLNFYKYYVMFFGGEPLLNFDIIPEYIDWFKNNYKNFDCDFLIFTNGILLDKSKVDFFIDNKIHIFLSFDTDYTHFVKNKSISENQFKHLTEIIKYSIQKNADMITPYYIIHSESISDLKDFCLELSTWGIKEIGITRKMFTKWDESDKKQVYEISKFVSSRFGIRILVYPDVLGSCSNCYPHNMMVYPNGDIYDLCMVCSSSLYKLGLINYDDLRIFYMGNIFNDNELKMDIIKKRNLIYNTDYHVINSFCPTISHDTNKF